MSPGTFDDLPVQDAIPASFVYQHAWISRRRPTRRLYAARRAWRLPCQQHTRRWRRRMREIQAEAYDFAGVFEVARLRPPFAACFLPLVAAAGPLAFLRALRLACSAAFASPA